MDTRDNHTITLDGRLALVDVFSRPDLTLAEGAASGQRLFDRLAKLADEGAIDAQLWDLVAAPVAGPRVREALHDFFGKPVIRTLRTAIVAEHPTHRMLYARLLSGAVGEQGAVFRKRDDALAFCQGGAPDSLPTWQPALTG